MRRVPAALACLLLAASATAAEDYAAIHARAAEAFGAGDLPGFRAAVVDALALRPDYPPMLYNLAMAESRLDRDDEALALLGRLADMGLAMPADPAAFPSLAGSPELERVLHRFEANGRPAGEARPAARLDGETGFLPEGVAVDPATGDLFVGSVRQRRIVRIRAATGEPADFAPQARGERWGVFGMRVAGGKLWVATSAVPETLDVPPEARGRAAVEVYDLATGTRLHRCVSPGPAVFGDVLPAGDGAWVSDSTGGVAHLSPADCAWRTLVPPGALVSPQGLVHGGPGTLYVADYRGGLFRVDTAGGDLHRLTGPENFSLYGIDGLDRSGEWLLAVQNGLRPHRVVALRLSADGERVVEGRVLARALAEFDEPTLGAVHDGDFLFVANSGWPRYAGEGGEPGGAPVVLAVPVPGGH